MFLSMRIIQRSAVPTALCAVVLAGCGHHAAQAASADAPMQVVAAKGVLQQCLGTAWGAARMIHGPATQSSCNRLPGAEIYNQAGRLYQSGDHAGAASVVTKAARAGNALAQLRLAIMYDRGDGVAHSAKGAFDWYAQAAAQGEPGAQEQLGGFYEQGTDVAENWDLAYKLYYTSAMQGWKAGQFSLGRAYEFGIGVAQDRAVAVAWFEKAAAQGAPRADYFANWLANPTNNIGFRNDTERNTVLAGKLRFALLGGDPAGIAFHSSQQRMQWLQRQAQGLNKTESDVFKAMRQADHDACVRAGRDNC
ncbi:MAG TPA: tetratricopeptide repeat protein [Steroidobacteraceae bacterium]